MNERKTIRLVTGDERTLEIRVGDKTVFDTDYDQIGWSGLEAVENAVRGLCEALKLPVEEHEE